MLRCWSIWIKYWVQETLANYSAAMVGLIMKLHANYYLWGAKCISPDPRKMCSFATRPLHLSCQVMPINPVLSFNPGHIMLMLPSSNSARSSSTTLITIWFMQSYNSNSFRKVTLYSTPFFNHLCIIFLFALVNTLLSPAAYLENCEGARARTGGRHFTQGERRTVVIGATFRRDFSSLEGRLKN